MSIILYKSLCILDLFTSDKYPERESMDKNPSEIDTYFFSPACVQQPVLSFLRTC